LFIFKIKKPVEVKIEPGSGIGIPFVIETKNYSLGK
jgi:hypothetical protein